MLLSKGRVILVEVNSSSNSSNTGLKSVFKVYLPTPSFLEWSSSVKGAVAPSASIASAASLSWASSQSTPAATLWIFSMGEYNNCNQNTRVSLAILLEMSTSAQSDLAVLPKKHKSYIIHSPSIYNSITLSLLLPAQIVEWYLDPWLRFDYEHHVQEYAGLQCSPQQFLPYAHPPSQGKKRCYLKLRYCTRSSKMTVKKLISLPTNEPNLSPAHIPFSPTGLISTIYCWPSNSTPLLGVGPVYPTKFSKWSISVELLPVFSILLEFTVTFTSDNTGSFSSRWVSSAVLK